MCPTDGTEFEKEFTDLLMDNGYWAMRITPSISGQPFDIIAVKGDIAIAVECKTISNKKGIFPISRIEPNQRESLRLWALCGNMNFIFAFRTLNGIYIINHFEMMRHNKSINVEETGTPFKEWKKEMDLKCTQT